MGFLLNISSLRQEGKELKCFFKFPFYTKYSLNFLEYIYYIDKCLYMLVHMACRYSAFAAHSGAIHQWAISIWTYRNIKQSLT